MLNFPIGLRKYFDAISLSILKLTLDVILLVATVPLASVSQRRRFVNTVFIVPNNQNRN